MAFSTRARALGSICALWLAGTAANRRAAAAPKIDTGDVKALGASLAAERATIKAYTDIVAAKVASAPVLAVLNQFLTDHSAHRDALVEALTAAGQQSADTSPPADTPAMSAESDVLAYLYSVERTIALAHLTALPEFKDHDYVSLTGSIVGVETTHVALLAEALRKSPPYQSGFVTA